MCKIFSLVSSKNPVTRENWDKLSVCFSILTEKIDQNTNFAKLPSAKWLFFWCIKLKSIHLVCLSFLWWQVFLRQREKIFYTYSGPNWPPGPPALTALEHRSQPPLAFQALAAWFLIALQQNWVNVLILTNDTTLGTWTLHWTELRNIA